MFICIKFRGGQPDNMYKLTYPNGKIQKSCFFGGTGGKTPEKSGAKPRKNLKGDDFLMNKTNFKKVFSVFLSVLMILSCWVWVAPDTHTHTHAEAAVAVDGTTIKIVVPETLYLTPSTSAVKTVQYYVTIRKTFQLLQMFLRIV